MLGSKALIAELQRLKVEGVTTNAKLSRLLEIPSSRVAEIFAGRRQVTIDEMKIAVEHFGLERIPAAPSAATLEPLVDALLPLVPPGTLTDQSRRALAEALSYGLGLLEVPSASAASPDALKVAARAAAVRFRETATAS